MICANIKQGYKETKYIAGKVEYINRRTKSIKMLIVGKYFVN